MTFITFASTAPLEPGSLFVRERGRPGVHLPPIVSVRSVLSVSVDEVSLELIIPDHLRRGSRMCTELPLQRGKVWANPSGETCAAAESICMNIYGSIRLRRLSLGVSATLRH